MSIFSIPNVSLCCNTDSFSEPYLLASVNIAVISACVKVSLALFLFWLSNTLCFISFSSPSSFLFFCSCSSASSLCLTSSSACPIKAYITFRCSSVIESTTSFIVFSLPFSILSSFSPCSNDKFSPV